MSTRSLKIIGYGTYLPEGKVMFGDQVRYRCEEGVTQVDMAEKAALKALENAGISIGEIDLILFASAVPAQLIPATATLLHEKIAKGTDIPAFDINSSCSSFITGLDIASLYLNAGMYKKILLVAGDRASSGLNPEQQESFELFSDAAAAVVLTLGDTRDQGIIASLQKTFSEGAHATEIRGGGTLHPGYVYEPKDRAEYLFDMKGKAALFSVARYLPKVFDEFFKTNQITLDDVDLIIPHQASRALSMFMSRMKVPAEKYVDMVTEYGNMVSGSVPFLLCKLLENGTLKKGNRVLLCGTAAGLTVNMLLLQL